MKTITSLLFALAILLLTPISNVIADTADYMALTAEVPFSEQCAIPTNKQIAKQKRQVPNKNLDKILINLPIMKYPMFHQKYENCTYRLQPIAQEHWRNI